MVPKFHKRGTSFRGLANYLLHDVDESTSERVAWTQTRNLATNRAEVAWKVMAATSMDQERLKRQAGVSGGGRKTKEVVLHLSCAWHPDEQESLTRKEMQRAANTLLHVMDAQDHQALIVCHTDGAAPHIHIVVNRVHPDHGRILRSSFERLKASRWAEQYEKMRGKIYCEERVLNNAARGRGEYPKAKDDAPRHVHDVSKDAATGDARREKMLKVHRHRAAKLKKAERESDRVYQNALLALQDKHVKLTAIVKQKAKDVITRNTAQIAERYRPDWALLFHQHQADDREFEQREADFKGRMQNAVKGIDFKGLFINDEDRNTTPIQALTKAFRLLTDPAVRRQELKSKQEEAKTRLQRQQDAEVQAAKRLRLAEQNKYLRQLRIRYVADRAEAAAVHAEERAVLKEKWTQKSKVWRRSLQRIRAAEMEKETLTQEFTRAARSAPSKKQDDSRAVAAKATPARAVTKQSDILPKDGAAKAVRQIDQWSEMHAKRLNRSRDRTHRRDDDRDR